MSEEDIKTQLQARDEFWKNHISENYLTNAQSVYMTVGGVLLGVYVGWLIWGT